MFRAAGKAGFGAGGANFDNQHLAGTLAVTSSKLLAGLEIWRAGGVPIGPPRMKVASTHKSLCGIHRGAQFGADSQMKQQ